MKCEAEGIIEVELPSTMGTTSKGKEYHLKASWCKMCMAEVQSERNRKNNKKY